MGCCSCRSKAAVTEDPDVSLHTVVAKTAMFNSHGSKMIGKQGLLYVRKKKLCHEKILGSKLCYKCLKTSWPLSEIKQITVMDGESLIVSGSKSKPLFLKPGVKMIFQDCKGNCQTLVTSLPHTTVDYADHFITQLRQCVDAASDKNS